MHPTFRLILENIKNSRIIIKIWKSSKQLSIKFFSKKWTYTLIFFDFKYFLAKNIFFLLNFSIKMFVYDVDDDDWDVKSSYY